MILEDFLSNQVPTAVREVEISELQPLTDLEGYQQAYVVFRYQGTVIGREWFPVIDGRVERQLLQRHCARLAWPIWQLLHSEEPLDGPEVSAVSVIVCTRDRTDDLANCLPELQRLAPRVHEVIIVDSCPSDGSTKDLVATYPEFRYVFEPRPGLGLARNTGIGASTGEFVAFTDDDAVIEDDWLENLLRNFGDPMVAVATGIALPIELETSAQVWFERTNSFVKRFDRRVFQSYYTPPLLAGITGAGVNLAIRKSALDEIGLFSVALGPGTPAGTGDDHEFLYRVLARGWKIVFDPRAVVWHKHRRDWDGLKRTIYTYGKGVYAWWTRALLKEKETTVFWYAPKWFFGFQFPNLLRSVLGRPTQYPLDLAWAEFRGALAGPLGYFKARRWQQTLPGLAQTDDLLPTYSAKINLESLAITNSSILPSKPPAKRQGIKLGTSSDPEISVVIPTHNRRDLLAESLQALARQSFPTSLFEVIVVADSCSDDTGAVVSELSSSLPYCLRLYQHDARSASVTRHRGAQEARGPILLFLDDDIEPDARLIEAHRSLADEDAVVLGYSKPVIGNNNSLWQLYARIWWEDSFLRMRYPGHRFTYRDFYSGNVSMPSELYWRAGGFDPAVRMRLEDYELGYRLLKAGAKFHFQPSALGFHHDITELLTWLARTRQEGEADVLISKIHTDLANQVFANSQVKWEGFWRLIRWSSFNSSPVSELLFDKLFRLALLVENLNQRGMYWRLTGALRQYQYWRGVADAIGDESALEELLQDAPFPASLSFDAPELDLEMLPGQRRVDEILTQANKHGLRLTFGGHEIATIMTQPGEESLRLSHIDRYYRDHLANNFVPALVLSQLLREVESNAY